MIYYANGCSYTWGGGLFSLHDDDARLWVPSLHEKHAVNVSRLQSVYPYHLGKMIGASQVINESLAGGSNFRIVRKTLEYFNNLLIKNKKITNHFVTIQWTDPTRYEFYDTYQNSWIAVTNLGYFTEKNNKKEDYLQDAYKNHYRMSSTQQDFANFINHVYALGNFFKVHNIPYLFCKHSGWDGPFFKESLIYYKDYYKLLLQFNWVKDNIEFHMQESGIEQVSKDDGHPGLLGHKQWADILAEDIANKKLLNFSFHL